MMSDMHDRFILIAPMPGLTLLSQKNMANILSLSVLDSDKILGFLIFLRSSFFSLPCSSLFFVS